MFFHPVTWWLSRRIRVERENCCDDIASRNTGQLSYAAALLRMAELCVGNDPQQTSTLASLAADGNNTTEFASRIRRLIGADDTPSFGLSRRGVFLLSTITLLASVSFVASASSQSGPGEPPIDPAKVSADDDGEKIKTIVRFTGGVQAVPIQGLQVTARIGHFKESKTFGPFTTDEDGLTEVILPTTGSYRLLLDSANETPWLPVDKQLKGKSRGANKRLYLNVKKDGVERWLDGKTSPHETTEDGERLVSFNLIQACEVTLRAVDVETGEGIAGAEFHTECALAEEWGHEIFGRNIGFKKPDSNKDRRTNSKGDFVRLLGADAGYTYFVWKSPPGYEVINPIKETEFNIRYGEKKAEHVFKFKRIPKFLWSKKARNGLLAGAKLLSATGKLKLGDPVVVQFALKNDSDKEQTFILQAIDSHPTLGTDNRLELNVLGDSQSTFQHTLKPGEILEKQQYRVSVDTNGMPPGNYQITSGSAFWQAKQDSPNAATGIPFRRKIPFTLGDSDSVKLTQPPADEDPETKIYWGKPTGNLIMGMQLPDGQLKWPDDQTDIEGQLFFV